MAKLTPALSSSEPDQGLLRTLTPVKRFCLAAVAIVAGITLFAWFFPALANFLPDGWRLMTAATALGLLLSAISLEFSSSRYSIRTYRISQLLAVLAALLGMAILAEYALHLSNGLERLLPSDPTSLSHWPDRPSPQTAAGLALLGITSALIRVRARMAVRAADLVAICLGLLVLALVSGEVFGALRLTGLSPITRTSPQTLVCLVILTIVAFLRRAEIGVFSIFLGRGIGSRIARTLAPFLLVLPFIREIGRAHLIHTRGIPEHYVTAILAAVATVLSFVFLIFLVWRIDSMEMEIRDLSLRDALTGLYNLRGFNVLAEQALRLAQRSHQPFSVLFVDLDGLKQINDSFGHDIGSKCLAETAEILNTTFRETDVIGRIGGDEFAVVGQCTRTAISIAAQRLEAAIASRNSRSGKPCPLSFSVGYFTAEEHGHESLQQLLAEADKAMYGEKRRKKTAASR